MGGEGGREKARRRSRFEVVANEQPRSDAGEVAENRCEDFASEFEAFRSSPFDNRATSLEGRGQGSSSSSGRGRFSHSHA